MAKLNYENWFGGTSQGYTDPTEFDGNNRKCNLCDKDAENMDEHCEEHQRCDFCGEHEQCDCEDDMKQRSDCCDAKMDTDQKLCYDCHDHCESAWDDWQEQKKADQIRKCL